MRQLGILATVTAVGAMIAASFAQPGDDKGPGKKGPPPKKGPHWEPGKIIPPPVIDALDLSAEQMEQVRELEKEVRSRLMKIFTEEQKRRLVEFQPKEPKDGPPKKGKGKDKPPPPKDCGEEGCGQKGGCGRVSFLQAPSENHLVVMTVRRENWGSVS